MCGQGDFDASRANKSSLDCALDRAWRKWAHRWTFPDAGFDNFSPRTSDPIWELQHATARHHTVFLYWEDGRICLRRGKPFDPENVAAAIAGGLAAESWQNLAEAVLHQLQSFDGNSQRFDEASDETTKSDPDPRSLASDTTKETDD